LYGTDADTYANSAANTNANTQANCDTHPISLPCTITSAQCAHQLPDL
jgi:hypothetical protein